MLGLSLSFAVKRWPVPEEWTRLVANEMGVRNIQFTFDIIDPWWPDKERRKLAQETKKYCNRHEIVIHSAFVGLSCYTYNGLLHPSPQARQVSREWWNRAVELSAELETGIIGGPLGGLSCAVSRDATKTNLIYQELLEFIHTLCEFAKKSGLTEFLIEPTPLVREFPHTIEQTLKLANELQDTAIPVRFLLDVGHALYRPLYGSSASMSAWFDKLGKHIGALHLQNTDFQSDSHWGWPHPQGQFDVAEFGKQVKHYNLESIPVFLEVFYPFEMPDEEVLSNIKSSIDHCRHQGQCQ